MAVRVDTQTSSQARTVAPVVEVVETSSAQEQVLREEPQSQVRALTVETDTAQHRELLPQVVVAEVLLLRVRTLCLRVVTVGQEQLTSQTGQSLRAQAHQMLMPVEVEDNLTNLAIAGAKVEPVEAVTQTVDFLQRELDKQEQPILVQAVEVQINSLLERATTEARES